MIWNMMCDVRCCCCVCWHIFPPFRTHLSSSHASCMCGDLGRETGDVVLLSLQHMCTSLYSIHRHHHHHHHHKPLIADNIIIIITHQHMLQSDRLKRTWSQLTLVLIGSLEYCASFACNALITATENGTTPGSRAIVQFLLQFVAVPRVTRCRQWCGGCGVIREVAAGVRGSVNELFRAVGTWIWTRGNQMGTAGLVMQSEYY